MKGLQCRKNIETGLNDLFGALVQPYATMIVAHKLPEPGWSQETYYVYERARATSVQKAAKESSGRVLDTVEGNIVAWWSL